MIKNIFVALLVFTPLALLAAHFHVSPLLVFIFSAIAIIPLAKYIGDATEQLATHTGPAFGGLMNATFGNVTELIIGIFALQAGLIEVVKASITGSIIGNILLVLGTAIFFGGLKREKQTFNLTAAKAAGSMLILAAIALVIPAVFAVTTPAVASISLLQLSFFVSLLMIFAYVAHLIFTLRTHKHLYAGEHGEKESEADLLAPNWKISTSIIILGLSTVAVAFVSDVLVAAITPLVTQFGWSQLFIGAILIAIVGNVAEHSSAIQAALKNRMDLALSISIGSATQIIMFVAPALVLVSFVLAKPMNLVFNLFELVSIVFAVFVVNAVTDDGESNWLEGVQLLVAYAILAVAFFLHT